MIKLGNNNIGSVALGDTSLDKIYKGSDLVYSSIHVPETDIALYDNIEKYEITVPTSKYNADDYPTNRYIPVGIVVIPAHISEELYPEGHENKGKPVIMSLKYLRHDYPDDGGEAASVYWGNDKTNLTLKNFQSYASITNTDEEEDVMSITSAYYNNYLNSTKFSSSECKVAPKTYYLSSPYHPSPVKYDKNIRKWILNPQFKNAPDTCPCTDLNGKVNTAIILENVTVDNWQTNSTITNSYSSGNYPAACCCWRYHIEGVDNQGDWYLPSLGELCFIMPFFDEHNNALTKIKNVYDTNSSILLGPGIFHWSSSEVGNTRALHIRAYNGSIYSSNKDDMRSIRAFRSLKIKQN